MVRPEAEALQIVDVYDGPESSGFGIYGTSPESPDGKRLCYVIYDSEEGGRLRICGSDLTDHRDLVKFHRERTPYHNGAHAFWVDNDRLAYRSDAHLYVLDANTGERLYGPFYLPDTTTHVSRDNKIIFFGFVGKDRALWELDCDTGQIRQITTLARVVSQEIAAGTEISDEMHHIQPNPSNTRVFFRHANKHETPISSILVKDGGLFVPFPRKKPMHFLWYDDDTIMGVNWNFPTWVHQPMDVDAFKEASKNHYYQRWHINGGVIETLAGPITHGAGSPDRQWYAGETADYGESPIELALYRKGQVEPTAVIFAHEFAELTWKKRVHVNPSFSRDGRRLYFWRAVSDDRFKAGFVDLSELIDRHVQVDEARADANPVPTEPRAFTVSPTKDNHGNGK